MNFSLIKDLFIGIIYCFCGFLIVPILAKKTNKKEINIYFSIVISTFYLFGIYISTFRWNRYNLQMLTPLSNVSPLLFTLTFIGLFLPEKHKTKLYKFMCIFNIVMIIAGFVSITYSIFLTTGYYKFIIFDELAHITYGLFVIFLLKSGQVKISKKDFLIDCFTMGCVLILVFAINLIFDTHLFGLCLTKDYSIYGNKIFDNCHISNLVYIISLIVVMISGYFSSKLFKIKH